MESDASVCRLCLVYADPCTMVVLNGNENLIKSIHDITSVKVIEGIHRCVYLCSSCQKFLDQCVQFRSTCLLNDNIFRKTYAECIVEDMKSIEPFLEECFIKVETVIDEPLNENVEEKVQPNDSAPDPNAVVSEEAPEKVDQQDPVVEEIKVKKKRRPKGSGKAKKVYDAQKVQCHVCGKLVARHNLVQHQEIHNPDRATYPCPHCSKVYTLSRKLKAHINAVHTHEVQYTCDKCGKVYARPETLRVHYIAAHTDIKRYECKLCGQKFARSRTRAHHFKVAHTTARPWVCEYCDKAFKIKSDWTIHTRTHTGEKPFKCDLCDKRFVKSYNVVIHKKSHRNDKKDNPPKERKPSGTGESKERKPSGTGDDLHFLGDMLFEK